MPIYEYQCKKCSKKIEVIQKMTDGPLTECDLCGGELKKLITSTSFVLKGEGWYVTDYPSADRKKAMDAKKATSPGKGKKTGKDKKPKKNPLKLDK